MAQLRHGYPEFLMRESEVIVIGPDDADAFKRYWLKEELPFIGLPDPTLSVLNRYGQETKLLKLGRMPAQVVVDKQGIARYVHYGHDMKDIPSNEALMTVLDEINAPVHPETLSLP